MLRGSPLPAAPAFPARETTVPSAASSRLRWVAPLVALALLLGCGSSGGSCPSPRVVCSGACVDPSQDDANCGGCGNACPAHTACAGGSCVSTCAAGTVLCGGECVDPLTDAFHCGAAGSCTGAGAGRACASGGVCSAGTCQATCQPGLLLCGGQCVDPLTDVRYCGASGDCTGASAGTTCPSGEVCSGGACGASCASGLVSCGGQCVDPATSPLFCGASGDCLGANAGVACAAGEVCKAGACACPDGAPNACGSGTTAFCTSFATDPGNCGGCGKACNSGQVCTSGNCAVSCSSGQTACAGGSGPGYCADLASDASNCGTCGHVCPSGQACTASQCACPPPAKDACASGSGAYCANLQSDPRNCGACGNACGAAQSCTGGVCTCPGGTPDACGAGAAATCTSFATDPQNCGACGNACGAAQSCTGGLCSCPPGAPDACGTGAAATCTTLATDPRNCGTCGKACAAFQVCAGGSCGCPSGEAACPAANPTACVSLSSDTSNCGACGNACGATQACAGGVCTCPAAAPDACGTGATATCTSFATDPQNCGTCGKACAAFQVCAGGTCGCPSGETACPAANPAACVSLSSDASNCGGCGVTCAAGQVCSAGSCVAAGRVLYTGDRAQSPITSDIASRIAAVSAATSGLRAPVFMKVGDSITASTSSNGVPAGYFMVCFDPRSGATVNLGSRPDLAAAVSYWQSVKATSTETPFARVSLAAYPGWSADMSYAGCPNANCPLLEEIAAVEPGTAVVMFGSNDSLCCGCGLTDAQIASIYFYRMRYIVDTLLANGVVPILSSMPPRTDLTQSMAGGCDGKQLGRATLFVNTTRAIAQARQVPFIDFFREMWPLPNNGLSGDDVHPSVCTDTVGETCRFDATPSTCAPSQPWNQYGYNVRNLVTLDALDRVRQVVTGTASSLDSNAPRMAGSGTSASPFVAAQLPFADVRNTATDGQSRIGSYSCAGSTPSPGPEVVYELVLSATTDLRIAVLDGGYATPGPFTLNLATAPDGTGCLASSDRFLSLSLAAGTYYVIVDTVAKAGAEFGLVIQECAAGGPQCPSP
ncbi:MAG TPA: GDSL-type esterase/lipase family protein [Anaeromyxobacteraceae bacterium]|nr:GDSL-type esterase/lipase family protein [Anaeromyxobacteraceae bacterium]